MTAIKVLIADDQELVRAGFRVLVDGAANLSVVAEAGDGAAAAEAAERTRPDVALMDIRMPRLDGISATRRILASCPGTRVIMLTMFDLDEYVYRALRAGASGFLLKDLPPGDLLNAIRVVAAGEALLAPTVTRRLIREFANRPEPPSLDGLTEREREILVLVAQGLQHGDLPAAIRQHGDRQDPRRTAARQARGQGPRPTGHRRLRRRPGLRRLPAIVT